MIDNRDRSDWSRIARDDVLPTFLRRCTRDDIRPVLVVDTRRPFRLSWVEAVGVVVMGGTLGFCLGYLLGHVTGH